MYVCYSRWVVLFEKETIQQRVTQYYVLDDICHLKQDNFIYPRSFNHTYLGVGV